MSQSSGALFYQQKSHFWERERQTNLDRHTVSEDRCGQVTFDKGRLTIRQRQVSTVLQSEGPRNTDIALK